jgi:peptidoglycan/LPS O-acetylase OafA/YrhL
MIKGYQPKILWAIIEADTSQHPDHNIFFSSGKRFLHRMAFALLPSFVQRRLRPGLTKPHRIHPTSYLDGLRGVASFVVFMGHYTEENLGWYTEPYGLYEDGAPSSPLQMPFIRVIYSARPMVHIFFIISGFVLSYKPLKQIHAQQYSALTTTLSSSVFRRALRLFLPSFVTLFVMAVAVYYGISDSRYAEPYYSLSSQLAHAWDSCWELSEASWAINDLGYPQPAYNPALWTIPVEFSQSLLLFAAILGLSRCIANVRLFLLAAMTTFCFYSGQIYAVEFLGGMFIAELTLIQDGSLSTPASSPTILPKFGDAEKDAGSLSASRAKGVFMKIFWFSNIISGLFIASWTNSHIEEVWGLRFLDAHTPSPYDGQRVWFCFAAFQIVAACTQLRCLQRIFTTRIALYLGNISYSLYLMHNLCLTTLEPRVRPILDNFYSRGSFWGRHFFWISGLMIYLPIIICVSDIFWRAIDTPTVKFARWLESKCVVEKRP